MGYRFFICDVFTEHALRRQPARRPARRPRARATAGCSRSPASSTSPRPPSCSRRRPGHTRRVRIFTPGDRAPVRGPSRTSARRSCWRPPASWGRWTTRSPSRSRSGRAWSRSRSRGAMGGYLVRAVGARALSLGAAVPVEPLAAAVSLAPGDVVTRDAPSAGGARSACRSCSRSSGTARRSGVRGRGMPGVDALVALGVVPGHPPLRAERRTSFDLRARMFAPLDGVPEDPATGSANCALAAPARAARPASDGQLRWRIAQGVEMGRPSVLEAAAEKREAWWSRRRSGGRRCSCAKERSRRTRRGAAPCARDRAAA